MKLNADQFTGCLLGLATGDALGAPHEGGPLERLIWRAIGRTSDGRLRWTDDTQMSLDLAQSLLEQGGLDTEALARRFASGYRWSRGYGPGTARALKRMRQGESWEQASRSVYPQGSYGNGAAMRAPVLSLFFPSDRDELVAAARRSAMVTHAHPIGIEGAVMIALAAHALLEGRAAAQVLEIVRSECSTPEMSERIATVAQWICSDESPGPRQAAAMLGSGTTANTSCPTALYIALRHMTGPFEALMEFVIGCRGDVDTIAAMAGALWGIANGADRLPQVRLESREQIFEIAMQLYRRRQSIESADSDRTSDPAE